MIRLKLFKLLTKIFLFLFLVFYLHFSLNLINKNPENKNTTLKNNTENPRVVERQSTINNSTKCTINQRLWNNIRDEYNLSKEEINLIDYGGHCETILTDIPNASDIWAVSGVVENKLMQQMLWQMEAKKVIGENVLSNKTIIIWDGIKWWNRENRIWNDYEKSLKSCPMTPHSLYEQCSFTEDRSRNGSMIIFTSDYAHTEKVEATDAITINYILESPFHSFGTINKPTELLASYWRGSDILTPYGYWIYFNEDIKFYPSSSKDYSKGKRLPAAIVVSNCNAPNGRLKLVEQLKKYIHVDVYGACGNECKDCFGKLKKDYFFYLAFENSNCRDYITEKLWSNAYMNDIVPIVLGAHPDDYKDLAPVGSYIHIEDFDSLSSLAAYMKSLMKNPDKYNSRVV